MSNFMKIRPVGAELLNAVWRTGTTKLVVVFCNLANAPKISFVSQDQYALLHSRVVTLWKYEYSGFIQVHTELNDG
jgi:hypothetical protein